MNNKAFAVVAVIFYFLTVSGACLDCDKALVKAVKQGNTQEVAQLIQNGANVNCVDESTGLTQLMIASSNGSKQIVERLLSSGANPNSQVKEDKIGAGYYEGLTAIAFAVLGKHEDIALFLLNKGADFELRDCDGGTILMGAVRLNMKKLALELLERGADVNAQVKNGYTALAIAVKLENAEMAKLLIKYGADPHIRILQGEDKGLTPKDLAEASKNEEMLRLLSDKTRK